MIARNRQDKSAPRPVSRPVSQRQLRVGELIRRALAESILRDDPLTGEFDAATISVSEVRASPDLRIATVYVRALKGDTPALVAALDGEKKRLRQEMARRVDLKYLPELRFRADDSLDQAERTEAILAKIAQDAAKREQSDGSDD